MSNTNNDTNLVQTDAPIQGAVSIYDNSNFHQLAQIAEMMAKTSLIPDSLKGKTEEETIGNCFLVAEQAQRWRISPYAAAQHASVIHGKLMWEGKLVSSAISAILGINLMYEYQGTGENMAIVASGTLRGESEKRIVSGTVKGWKTSQWKEVDYEQRLSYRAAREWARRHAPGVILGVLTDDEELPAKKPARNITLKKIALPSFVQQDEVKEEPPAPQNEEKQEDLISITIKGHKTESGETNGKKWEYHAVTLEDDNGKSVVAKTFSKTIGGIAEFNVGSKALAQLAKTAKGGVELKSLELVEKEVQA